MNEMKDELFLTLELIGSNTVRMNISDGSDRFIVPEEALNQDSFFKNQKNADTTLEDFVSVSKDGEKFSYEYFAKDMLNLIKEIDDNN